MRPRARAVWRWLPTGAYLGLIGYGIGMTPSTNSVHQLKFGVIGGLAGTAIWFLQWRSEDRKRARAEQLAERARQQGVEPCPVCQHYACDGVECITCEGPCRPPRLTGPVERVSYWLN